MRPACSLTLRAISCYNAVCANEDRVRRQAHENQYTSHTTSKTDGGMAHYGEMAVHLSIYNNVCMTLPK